MTQKKSHINLKHLILMTIVIRIDSVKYNEYDSNNDNDSKSEENL